MSDGGRAGIAEALLERTRTLTDTLDLAIVDHYDKALLETAGGIVYIADIDGRVVPHGGTSEPFRWRDEFTINLEAAILIPAPDDAELGGIRTQIGDLIDVVIAAVSTCWDPSDDRTRLVEPGAELSIDGPNPGVWGDPTSGRLITWADIQIDLARQLQPTAEEAS